MFSAIMGTFKITESSDSQARRLFDGHRREIVDRTNRMFVVLLGLQWLGGVVAALIVSPRTWAGATSWTHLHVWAALILGGLLSGYPIVRIWRQPQERLTQHVVAVAQMLWSALLIHLSGGRIETHFHVFGSLAFLAMYRNWSVILSATVVIAADHAVRGALWPQSVYGVLSATPWRSFEHAAWIVFEDIFLLYSIRCSIGEMWVIADRRARLEKTNERIEAQVRERTAQLEARTQELEEARQRAEAATRTKSRFLANMSHEIRTPMSAILGFTDVLMADDATESERLNAIQTVKRNGQHLLSLINDILDLSKIEAGKMETERVACHTRRLLFDAASLLRSKAEDKGLALRIEIEGEIPDRIMTDPTRLKQALVNLTGNAIKFTDRGVIRIVASCDAEKELIRFRVIDEGIGIAPDQIELLFQPFQQAESSTTRRFGGTGLGLAIVKRIAEMLGGGVSVESTPGQGSTFTLCVETGPLDGVQMVTASDPTPTDLALPRKADELPSIAGRILLAEDGIDNQRLISLFLRKGGAKVEIADTGTLAVERALAAQRAGEPFDVILMDIQMPEMDGYEATRTLRRCGYTGQIIALTAHAMKGEMQKCIDAGCDHYLSKPIPREILVREVAARMRRPSLHAQGSAAALR